MNHVSDVKLVFLLVLFLGVGWVIDRMFRGKWWR
jgi:flagellar biogenesis protein FliO